MNKRITSNWLQLMIFSAILYGSTACDQTSEDQEVQVQLHLTMSESGSGGSGGGTGGSSRDTTLVTTGKVTGGVVKLDVPVMLPPRKGIYQLDTMRFSNKAMRMVRYVRMSSDTGGSSPDTLYYKAPRDGKDDDGRR